MNARIKKKWLKALRSGEYVQGRSRLVNKNDEFCCMGVLCDLYAHEKGDHWVIWVDGNWALKGDDEGDFAFLPDCVMKWAEIESGNPLVNEGKNKATLSYCNDTKRWSFNRIADLIEESL